MPVWFHGQSRLVEEFAASIMPAVDPAADSRQLDETAGVRCALWLAEHGKRSLLSPAGVGTIDQVLLAVLTSKHQCLRLLGLFRKADSGRSACLRCLYAAGTGNCAYFSCVCGW